MDCFTSTFTTAASQPTTTDYHCVEIRKQAPNLSDQIQARCKSSIHCDSLYFQLFDQWLGEGTL